MTVLSPSALPQRTRRAARRERAGHRLTPGGLALIAPAVLLMLVVFVGALLTLLEYSFHVTGAGTEDIGLGTWTSFLTSAYRLEVVRETVVIGLTVTVVTVLIGIPTAYALHRIRRPAWRTFGLFVVFAPLLTSVVSRTYGWSLLLGDQGFVNSALAAAGLPPLQLLYERPAVVIALAHILLPFMVFPVMTSLGQIDGATNEAARDLGASPAQRMLRVTLPLVATGALGGAQLVFAMAISSFATPSLLGGGRVTVLATLVYGDINNVRWPMASVTSYVLLGLALAVLGLVALAQRRTRVPGTSGVTATGELKGIGPGTGIWLSGVYAFMLAPLVIIVISSFSSVSYGAWPPPGWSTRWYENLFAQEGLVEATLASLAIAAWTTVLTLAIGTAAAVAMFRWPGRLLSAFGTFTLSPTIVPKVALGIAGFIFLQRIGAGQGTLGIVLMHTIATLPFAVIVISAALARTDTALDEAARDLGAGALRAFAATTLPAIRPAIVAAGLFVFIISFDEVDMTVFLLSPGQQTLPVWMFTYMQRYQDPTLAALSTILITASLAVAVAAALALRSVQRRTAPEGADAVPIESRHPAERSSS